MLTDRSIAVFAASRGEGLHSKLQVSGIAATIPELQQVGFHYAA
jgi:hypothetical protein